MSFEEYSGKQKNDLDEKAKIKREEVYTRVLINNIIFRILNIMNGNKNRKKRRKEINEIYIKLKL